MSTDVSAPNVTDQRYLSRFRLDIRHPRVQRALGDEQEMHRLVMSLFPDVPDEAARKAMAVLYRVDSPRETAGQPSGGIPAATLLVQSAVEPDLAHSGWSPGMLSRSTGAVATKPISAAFEAIRANQRLEFRLRANPTKRFALKRDAANDERDRVPAGLLEFHRQKGRSTGPRVALLREDDQIAWLVRQGEQHGFRLVEQDRSWEFDDEPTPKNYALTVASAKVGGARGPNRQRTGLTHLAATFDGELIVTNPDAFREALREGVGPAKAYGFGLLSVRRPR